MGRKPLIPGPNRDSFKAFERGAGNYADKRRRRRERRLRRRRRGVRRGGQEEDPTDVADVVEDPSDALGDDAGAAGAKEWKSLLDNVVFRDELVSYVSSVINNADPNEFVWDDLVVAPHSTKLGGANDPDFGLFVNNCKTYLFDKAADEEVFFQAQLPHSYMEGTDVNFHVHWAPMDGDAGNVVWALEYGWFNIAAGLPGGATQTITATVAAPAAIKQHTYSAIDTIDGTQGGVDRTISSILVCRFYRDANNAADTYDDDCALLGLDFHFKKDARGSATATAK